MNAYSLTLLSEAVTPLRVVIVATVLVVLILFTLWSSRFIHEANFERHLLKKDFGYLDHEAEIIFSMIGDLDAALRSNPTSVTLRLKLDFLHRKRVALEKIREALYADDMREAMEAFKEFRAA